MGMTLRTSDERTEALRRQAAAEGRSIQAVALSASDEYIVRREHEGKVDKPSIPTSDHGSTWSIGLPDGRWVSR
jgi:hypothetical protein